MTTFHRGASVSTVRLGILGSGRAYPGARFFPFQWDDLRDKSKELTGAQLAANSKPSRQRRKGPIVRFGRNA